MIRRRVGDAGDNRTEVVVRLLRILTGINARVFAPSDICQPVPLPPSISVAVFLSRLVSFVGTLRSRPLIASGLSRNVTFAAAAGRAAPLTRAEKTDRDLSCARGLHVHALWRFRVLARHGGGGGTREKRDARVYGTYVGRDRTITEPRCSVLLNPPCP